MPNVQAQRRATLDEPHRPILMRVRCIALFSLIRLLLLSGLGDLQFATDFLCHEVVDFAMPRNRCHFSRGRVEVHRVPSTFPQEGTTVGLNMMDGGSSRLASSRSKLKRLSFNIFSRQRLLRQFPIGFENQLDGFAQVLTNLIKRLALAVGAWNLLNKPDIALGHRHIDGGKRQRSTYGFELWRTILTGKA